MDKENKSPSKEDILIELEEARHNLVIADLEKIDLRLRLIQNELGLVYILQKRSASFSFWISLFFTVFITSVVAYTVSILFLIVAGLAAILIIVYSIRFYLEGKKIDENKIRIIRRHVDDQRAKGIPEELIRKSFSERIFHL